VSAVPLRRLPYWVVYPAWIALCAILFFALRGLPDPSRPGDRLGRAEAGERAIGYLLATDSQRFAGFEPVHTAHSPRGELGPEARWVVLCDRPAGERLQEAVVVEIRASDGELIRIRPPVIR
jgi:hypothetical protein